MVRKTNFLSISVIVSEIVNFMSKKNSSLWISPKMLQNNRKAWFSSMWPTLWRKTVFFHIYPLLLVWSKTLKGENYTIFLRNLQIFCTYHNFFPFFCANNYCTSLFLSLCALRWYVKCRYRHFFRRYSQTRKGHKKNGTSQMANPLISRRLELQTLNFLCCLLTP